MRKLKGLGPGVQVKPTQVSMQDVPTPAGILRTISSACQDLTSAFTHLVRIASTPQATVPQHCSRGHRSHSPVSLARVAQSFLVPVVASARGMDP